VELEPVLEHLPFREDERRLLTTRVLKVLDYAACLHPIRRRVPYRRLVVTAPDADRPAHLSSFDRPLQIGWIDPGAAWCAVWIGEPHRVDQWALLPFSHANESWIDLIEHQLGATEHLEAPLVVDVAPREVQEAIAALAVNCRTPEVRRAIRSGHNADVELPSGSGHVAGDKVVWFVSDLDTDMDVVEWSAVGIAETSGPGDRIPR
jgi:hypothetical protein